MLFNNYFWFFKSALPKRFCDEVVKYALSQNDDLAITGSEGMDRDTKKKPLEEYEISRLKKTRNSDIVWLEENWIYKEINPYINAANKNAGWNFEWNCSEACQFTKYKINQHYDWHCDAWAKPYNTPNKAKQHGKIRKLSVTCQLSDGAEYEGGELQVDTRSYEPHMRDEEKHLLTLKDALPKGSIIVFPSFVWHRVQPVTKGTRYSLVLWNLGHPYK